MSQESVHGIPHGVDVGGGGEGGGSHGNFFVDRAADHCDELTDEDDDPVLQLLAPFK